MHWKGGINFVFFGWILCQFEGIKGEKKTCKKDGGEKVQAKGVYWNMSWQWTVQNTDKVSSKVGQITEFFKSNHFELSNDAMSFKLIILRPAKNTCILLTENICQCNSIWK